MICYAQILRESLVDGVGLRTAVFLQGCPRHCLGCHNEALLSSEGGMQVGEAEFAALVLREISPLHRGITFSGGDPLLQADALTTVLRIIRHQNPRLNIWVYTGYLYEEVAHLPIMEFIDVLVDGPFMIEQRNLCLAFRGSSNQRIIDVVQTRLTGTIVEIPLDS